MWPAFLTRLALEGCTWWGGSVSILSVASYKVDGSIPFLVQPQILWITSKWHDGRKVKPMDSLWDRRSIGGTLWKSMEDRRRAGGLLWENHLHSLPFGYASLYFHIESTPLPRTPSVSPHWGISLRPGSCLLTLGQSEWDSSGSAPWVSSSVSGHP